MLRNEKPLAEIYHIHNTEGTGVVATGTGKFAQKVRVLNYYHSYFHLKYCLSYMTVDFLFTSLGRQQKIRAFCKRIRKPNRPTQKYRQMKKYSCAMCMCNHADVSRSVIAMYLTLMWNRSNPTKIMESVT